MNPSAWNKLRTKKWGSKEYNFAEEIAYVSTQTLLAYSRHYPRRFRFRGSS